MGFAYAHGMIVGSAHTAICVPDVEEAVRWYTEVLGLRVLSPPYRMVGDAIEKDMGELVPSPVVLKAAIVGTQTDEHVIELIEYPNVDHGAYFANGETSDAAVVPVDVALTRPGITHVGLVCDDLESTRSELEGRGVSFLTSGNADVAGLRTSWFRDPWGSIFILMEKDDQSRPYWRQSAP
jgi:catechol 2,3-dioxygenase-like lactoylglutathione lyase family enzyme